MSRHSFYFKLKTYETKLIAYNLFQILRLNYVISEYINNIHDCFINTVSSMKGEYKSIHIWSMCNRF